MLPQRVRLIQFNGREGIVRCAHLDQNKVVEKITTLVIDKKGEKGGFRTIGCSGTIRSLCTKYQIIKKGKEESY
jgi:RNase P/RNase MRP subunit POP5